MIFLHIASILSYIMIKKLATEFIGTFFLVLVIALSGEPIAIGAILIAMIYMGGYISGAHYNPAVTFAVMLTGKIPREDAIRYIGVQILGALSAAFIAYLVTGNAIVPRPSTDITFITLILVEAIFTFALCSVVLHATTTKETVGNEYYALAIGLTVMANAFTIGPISGGVINPAVAIGMILVDIPNLLYNIGNMVFYVSGALVGSAISASIFSSLLKDAPPREPRKPN